MIHGLAETKRVGTFKCNIRKLGSCDGKNLVQVGKKQTGTSEIIKMAERSREGWMAGQC